MFKRSEVDTATATLGAFGDTYGLINALFSGLAFSALILTLWLQNKELKLQRHELHRTTQQMKGQKEALEAQKTQMQLQSKLLTEQGHRSHFQYLLEMYATTYAAKKDPYVNNMITSIRREAKIHLQHPERTVKEQWLKSRATIPDVLAMLTLLLKYVANIPPDFDHLRKEIQDLLRAKLEPEAKIMILYEIAFISDNEDVEQAAKTVHLFPDNDPFFTEEDHIIEALRPHLSPTLQRLKGLGP